MPIKLMDESEAPQHRRESKILKAAEWTEIKDHLETGIPKGKVLTATLSEETLKKFKSPDKAAFAFVQRLRQDYKKQFKIRQVGSEILIFNLDKKKA